MAEPVSAVVGLITAGLKTWNVLEAFIRAIQDAPIDIEHWHAVTDLLTICCSQMEDKVRDLTNMPLTRSEIAYVVSVRRYLDAFKNDLRKLMDGLPDAETFRAGNANVIKRTITAFKYNITTDNRLIVRVERAIKIFNISAKCLKSVHQKSTELGEVRKVLDDLGGAFPKRADDEDELQQWRQQTQSLLDAAVQGLSDCSDPPDTPADDNEILPPGITSPQEYTASEFLFIAAQKLARRFCGIGMPILAMPYQLQAIKIWKALQDQQVDLAIDLDNQLLLTEKYVDIVLSCRKFDETAIPDSLEQLKTLEAAILTLLDPGTPEICNALRRIGKMHSLLSESKEAIRLFQGTLDTCIDLHKSSEAGYLTQIGTTYDLIVEECQRSHDFLTLEALRGRISRDMGPEFVEQRKMLASTIKWCEERGFTVKAEGDYTFTHEKTNSKNTPLHEAARDPEMDMGILEEIMKVEVFYDAEDGNLDTPLLVAVSRKNVNVVAELLRRRPYLVHVRDKRKKTPLHRCRDTKTLSLIFDALIATANLDNPAQKQMIGIESQDEVGQTALHSFCEIGDSKLVELLIDRGADVNARGPYGETPLMLALEKCRNGKDLDHIIRKLARAGAALEGRDGLGHDVKRLLKDRRYDKSKLAKLTSRSYDSSRRSSYRASLDSDLAGTLTATRTNATEPGKSRFRYFWR